MGLERRIFARDYLPVIARLIHFVNADLIAEGISPLRPELAAIAAGRMVLRELNRLVEARAEFAFEITLSGLHYARRLEDWKSRGYLIEIVYIRLASPQLALSRISSRVRQGGHDVPRTDVIRRFKRGWTNFSMCTSPWRIIGQYTRILNPNRECWSADHDHSTKIAKEAGELCCRGWSWDAARRTYCPRSGAHARNTDLRLGRR
jgi:hypothetical protein